MTTKKIGTPGEARRYKYDHSSGHAMDVQDHDEMIEEFMQKNPERVHRLRTATQGGKNLKRKMPKFKDGAVVIPLFDELERLTINSDD